MRTIIKVGIAMLGYLASAVGISLDIGGVTKNASFIEKWWPLFTLLLFGIFIIWAMIDLYKKNQGLEDKHPNAIVNPKFESDSAYLEIQNTGNFDAEFFVQVLKWEGIEGITPQINREYNTKWLNNYNNPNSPVYKLLPHQHNRVILIHTIGLKSLPEDKIRFQNVEMPSQFETWQGQAQIESPIIVSIQIGASSKLKTETKLDFTFQVHEKGNWSYQK